MGATLNRCLRELAGRLLDLRRSVNTLAELGVCVLGLSAADRELPVRGPAWPHGGW
jgi:hypothetical protein